MMKQFKKIVLATTAAFLLLAATSGTTTLLPLPSVTVGQEEAEPTPLPEESNIQPLVDEDDEAQIDKTF